MRKIILVICMILFLSPISFVFAQDFPPTGPVFFLFVKDSYEGGGYSVEYFLTLADVQAAIKQHSKESLIPAMFVCDTYYPLEWINSTPKVVEKVIENEQNWKFKASVPLN